MFLFHYLFIPRQCNLILNLKKNKKEHTLVFNFHIKKLSDIRYFIKLLHKNNTKK
jgi:hypothetical protein